MNTQGQQERVIQDKHGRSEVDDSAVHTLTHINHGSQVNVRGFPGEGGTSGVDDKCCLAEQQPVHESCLDTLHGSSTLRACTA